MALFLLASFPLFSLLLVWLPWRPERAPDMTFLVGTFFKGLLMFFPGLLAILIVRGIFGFSYAGFVLFLSLLQRDQLVPLLAAIASLLILRSNLQISGTEEENFLGVFVFLAGFMTMQNITDVLRAWGNWNSYLLFLLPLQRLATVLLISLIAHKFFPWEGRDAVFLIVIATAISAAFTVPAFFSYSREGWAVLLTVLPLLAAVLWFTMKFPRVVRA